MSYFEQLHPWAIIRPLLNQQPIVVARFRRRPDAEAHLQILQGMLPAVPFKIVFDAPSASTDSTSSSTEDSKVTGSSNCSEGQSADSIGHQPIIETEQSPDPADEGSKLGSQ